MNLIGNLIWLVFGGLAAALGYIVGGFFLCMTIVGIPFGMQCFKIAGLVLWPFGRQVVPARGGMGCLSLFFNIIWLICGGLYTALVHLLFAAILFIHPVHLSNTIKLTTGHSPCYFFEDKLMKEARKMLREEPFTIAEIAERLTFDTSNFTKFFKRFEGVTPSAYRQQVLEAGRKQEAIFIS